MLNLGRGVVGMGGGVSEESMVKPRGREEERRECGSPSNEKEARGGSPP